MNFRRSNYEVKYMTLTNRLVTAALRKVTIGLVAMGLVLSASTHFGTTLAHADTTYPVGTIMPGASCDYSKHSMTMFGQIHLSDRFPNGAYVATRYAYYWVDKAGQPTTGIAYSTTWSLPIWVGPPNKVFPDGSTMGWFYDLPPQTIVVLGHLHAEVQVGVWNGRYYEYSNWYTPETYTDYGGSVGQTSSDCWASQSN